MHVTAHSKPHKQKQTQTYPEKLHIKYFSYNDTLEPQMIHFAILWTNVNMCHNKYCEQKPKYERESSTPVYFFSFKVAYVNKNK